MSVEFCESLSIFVAGRHSEHLEALEILYELMSVFRFD